MSISHIVAVVAAVKRINIPVPQSITFFSRNDEWMYVAEFDNNVCGPCLEFENQTLMGDMLRSLFPFLEIENLELIRPNTHPNCRCRLERVLYMGDIGVEQ